MTEAPTSTRFARRKDAAAIARIYSEGIEDRLATFETEHRQASDVKVMLDGQAGRH